MFLKEEQVYKQSKFSKEAEFKNKFYMKVAEQKIVLNKNSVERDYLAKYTTRAK